MKYLPNFLIHVITGVFMATTGLGWFISGLGMHSMAAMTSIVGVLIMVFGIMATVASAKEEMKR